MSRQMRDGSTKNFAQNAPRSIRSRLTERELRRNWARQSMDITRGSRRARHVAANTAATGAAPAPRSLNQQEGQPLQTAATERQQLRPQPAARDMHRTPDQRLPDDDGGPAMAAAPRANPFRLHRSKYTPWGYVAVLDRLRGQVVCSFPKAATCSCSAS